MAVLLAGIYAIYSAFGMLSHGQYTAFYWTGGVGAFLIITTCLWPIISKVAAKVKKVGSAITSRPATVSDNYNVEETA